MLTYSLVLYFFICISKVTKKKRNWQEPLNSKIMNWNLAMLCKAWLWKLTRRRKSVITFKMSTMRTVLKIQRSNVVLLNINERINPLKLNHGLNSLWKQTLLEKTKYLPKNKIEIKSRYYFACSLYTKSIELKMSKHFLVYKIYLSEHTVGV